jgi:hypothetical protein
MFFKKQASPEQFEFATIISTAQYFNLHGHMPSADKIEKNVVDVLSKVNTKLGAQQMIVLRAAASLLCFSSECEKYIKMIASKSDTDGKKYAEFVKVLQNHGVYFI